MAKKITIDVLAQLVEERAQGIEKHIKGIEEKMATKELVLELMAVVKNIEEKMGDIKASTASALEVANIEFRMDAMELSIRSIRFQFPEFQAAGREWSPIPAVVGYLPVTLTRV